MNDVSIVDASKISKTNSTKTTYLNKEVVESHGRWIVQNNFLPGQIGSNPKKSANNLKADIRIIKYSPVLVSTISQM